MAEWTIAPDCKSGARKGYLGSYPSLGTEFMPTNVKMEIKCEYPNGCPFVPILDRAVMIENELERLKGSVLESYDPKEIRILADKIRDQEQLQIANETKKNQLHPCKYCLTQ